MKKFLLALVLVFAASTLQPGYAQTDSVKHKTEHAMKKGERKAKKSGKKAAHKAKKSTKTDKYNKQM
ncbi:MAG TPA: hypothetical protein VK470_20455 [Bacteroidota bacterium]|nr:hypothetical protein [Bacteroidota bacterium]